MRRDRRTAVAAARLALYGAGEAEAAVKGAAGWGGRGGTAGTAASEGGGGRPRTCGNSRRLRCSDTSAQFRNTQR